MYHPGLLSNPKECDSHSGCSRCVQIRTAGLSPSMAMIANMLDRLRDWWHVCTTHHPLQHGSDDDNIHVHSQWLNMYYLVRPHPPIDMLKFSGCPSTVSYRGRIASHIMHVSNLLARTAVSGIYAAFVNMMWRYNSTFANTSDILNLWLHIIHTSYHTITHERCEMTQLHSRHGMNISRHNERESATAHTIIHRQWWCDNNLSKYRIAF